MINKTDNSQVIKILNFGVKSSGAIIALGLIMFLVSGTGGYGGGRYPTSIGSIISGSIMLRPYAIIMLGLIVLIMTPVLRVVVSIKMYFDMKDYLYVKITSVVLFILIVSFFIGKMV